MPRTQTKSQADLYAQLSGNARWASTLLMFTVLFRYDSQELLFGQDKTFRLRQVPPAQDRILEEISREIEESVRDSTSPHQLGANLANLFRVGIDARFPEYNGQSEMFYLLKLDKRRVQNFVKELNERTPSQAAIPDNATLHYVLDKMFEHLFPGLLHEWRPNYNQIVSHPEITVQQARGIEKGLGHIVDILDKARNGGRGDDAEPTSSFVASAYPRPGGYAWQRPHACYLASIAGCWEMDKVEEVPHAFVFKDYETLTAAARSASIAVILTALWDDHSQILWHHVGLCPPPVISLLTCKSETDNSESELSKVYSAMARIITNSVTPRQLEGGMSDLFNVKLKDGSPQTTEALKSYQFYRTEKEDFLKMITHLEIQQHNMFRPSITVVSVSTFGDALQGLFDWIFPGFSQRCWPQVPFAVQHPRLVKVQAAAIQQGLDVIWHLIRHAQAGESRIPFLSNTVQQSSGHAEEILQHVAQWSFFIKLTLLPGLERSCANTLVPATWRLILTHIAEQIHIYEPGET
ncbi:hypothetical protein OIV83_005593 [Microbotryomycetes sp. JL201]|nr:hypothetical protein OIV83_005593 [Microbotryomycetes sp. JL201]